MKAHGRTSLNIKWIRSGVISACHECWHLLVIVSPSSFALCEGGTGLKWWPTCLVTAPAAICTLLLSASVSCDVDLTIIAHREFPPRAAYNLTNKRKVVLPQRINRNGFGSISHPTPQTALGRWYKIHLCITAELWTSRARTRTLYFPRHQTV